MEVLLALLQECVTRHGPDLSCRSHQTSLPQVPVDQERHIPMWESRRAVSRRLPVSYGVWHGTQEGTQHTLLTGILTLALQLLQGLLQPIWPFPAEVARGQALPALQLVWHDASAAAGTVPEGRAPQVSQHRGL